MSGYYELLGVRRDASETEIRSAYGRDVLRLQADPPRNAAEIRAALDEAFAVLTDPAKRGQYDASLVNATHDRQELNESEADHAFARARNGALWLAGGGIVTAGTYLLAPGGMYFIAWGPILFGFFRFVTGLLFYLKTGVAFRQSPRLLLLGGLMCVGLLSAAFVTWSEVYGAQLAADEGKWNSMINSTNSAVSQASDIVKGVFDREGAWTLQDSNDMARASELYGIVADTFSSAKAPDRIEWYRAGLAKNLRDAQAITHDYSLLTSNAPSSAVSALDARWQARMSDLKRLNDAFDAQEGSGP